MSRKTTTTKTTSPTSGWVKTKCTTDYGTGGFEVDVTFSKPGVIYTFHVSKFVRTDGTVRRERVVMTPSGNVQERLTCLKCQLSERLAEMERTSDFVKAKKK